MGCPTCCLVLATVPAHVWLMPKKPETVEKRLAREYPWLTPECIATLREQGVDPEAYAKRASRLRLDPDDASIIGTTPTQTATDKEMNETVERFDD